MEAKAIKTVSGDIPGFGPSVSNHGNCYMNGRTPAWAVQDKNGDIYCWVNVKWAAVRIANMLNDKFDGVYPEVGDVFDIWKGESAGIETWDHDAQMAHPWVCPLRKLDNVREM